MLFLERTNDVASPKSLKNS